MNRLTSFAVGTAVLGGVAVLSWSLLQQPLDEPPQVVERPAQESQRPVAIGELAPAMARPAGDGDQAELARRIGGVVLLPSGRPAAGTTVTLHRQRAAWPEWQPELLDTALTGLDGQFRFRFERGPNLLVGFEHPEFAGSLQEAPPCEPELTLVLQRGFEVEGIVTNDTGLPVADARVALESPLGDLRRAQAVVTGRTGRFRFQNVQQGSVRLIARHEWWQPIILPNVVVGVERRLELRFERPALSLEGRVVSGATQEPVAGARILALSPGQLVGQHDPAETMTRGDGTFRLGGLARGNLQLEVRHPSFAVAVRTLVIGTAPPPVTVDLLPLAEVRGRLDAEGLGSIEGMTLTLRSEAGEITATAISSDGRFVFPRPVTPGWATLRIDDARCAFRQSLSSQLPIRVAESRATEHVLAVVPAAVLRGRVVAADGAPVAGARLSVTQAELVAERLRQAGSALLERDLGKLGDQFARSSAIAPEVLLAVTDAQGRFRIAGSPPGPLALRIAHPGHGIRRLECQVPGPGDAAEPLEVDLPPACRIGGRVVRGGRPLAGALVWVTVQGLQVGTVSGLDGRFELSNLPPGEYRVRARYSTLPHALSSRPAAVSPARPGRVDLEFPPGRVVRGVVEGSDGQPVEGAMVLVRGVNGTPAVTDASGSFQLEAPNRALELQVLFGDRSASRITSVPADRDRVTIAIETPPICTLTARVLGLPGRRRIASLLLRVGPPGSDDGFGEQQTRAVDLADGVLRYPWFPAGSWRVVLWSEGYAPRVLELELAPGEEHDLGEILLEPGCALQGVVVDEGSRPIAGAEVFLGDPADVDLFQPSLRSGADGGFVLRGVSSVANQLVVRAPGYATTALPLRLPQDVLVREPLRIVLQVGATIEVRVGGATAVEGSIVVLRRGGRVLATADVDESGRALFANCAPGDYVVQRFGYDVTTPVRVRGSGETIRVALD